MLVELVLCPLTFWGAPSALINKIAVDDQFKNTDLLIYENFIGKCYQIKDQLLIVIIYSTYIIIYPVNLNYEIVDFRLNFAHVSLLFTFIMRRSAVNKLLKLRKKCEDKLRKIL